MLTETESAVCPQLRQAYKGQPSVRVAGEGPESLTGEEKLSSAEWGVFWSSLCSLVGFIFFFLVGIIKSFPCPFMGLFHV